MLSCTGACMADKMRKGCQTPTQSVALLYYESNGDIV